MGKKLKKMRKTKGMEKRFCPNRAKLLSFFNFDKAIILKLNVISIDSANLIKYQPRNYT